jgi:hypothetical protein
MKFLLQSLLFILPAVGYQNIAEAGGIKKVPGDSTVQGFIIDYLTKKPVSDVVISICYKQGGGCKEIKSDASGFFAISQLLPGEFTLVVEKDGYKSFRRGVIIPKEGLVFKLSLVEDEEEGSDTWNPFRVLFDR